MWTCIFSSVINRGKRCNDPNGPGEGEFAKDLDPSVCAWFNEYPTRYMWDEATKELADWPGWQDEELEKTKGRVWERIKAERDRRMDGGFKVEVEPGVFKWYHSDPKSRTQHLGLVLAGAAVPPVQWKTMDGTKVSMSQTIAQAIFQAGMVLDGALFTRAEQHKAAMEASPDPLSYDFSTGWPENYLGL